MRLLLDTQVLIWYLEGNQQLPRPSRHLIVDSRNEIYVSIASLWEIAVKASTGKLKVSRSLADILPVLHDQSIDILQIMPGHVLQVATLPFHHRDAFDRMLVAQAQVEFLTIMTHDNIFSQYGIKTI